MPTERRHARNDLCHPADHPTDDRGCAGFVPGEPPKPVDLLVSLREISRGRLHDDLDPELAELAGEALRVVRDEDEVGVIAGDRLDVRRVAGETRLRGSPRIVRLRVDGDDLLAGAD